MYKNVLLTTTEIEMLHRFISDYLYQNNNQITHKDAINLHIINRNLNSLISSKNTQKITNQ